MKDYTVDFFKDWLTLLLAGLGISLQTHEFFGGLFLALFAASMARKLSPEQDDRELIVVLGTAALAAIVTAEIISHWFPETAPQMFMAAAGFTSRYLARFFLRVAGMVEKRADEVTDRVIDKYLPGDDKEDNK